MWPFKAPRATPTSAPSTAFAPAPLPAKIRPAVSAIIDLLTNHPEEWTFGGHDATHTLGARVHAVGHHRWSTTLTLPGLSEVVRESEPRQETPEQKALFAALRGAQDALFDNVAADYIASAAERRGGRRRQLLEDARRAEHDAESLRLAATRTAARAAEMRQGAERLPQIDKNDR